MRSLHPLLIVMLLVAACTSAAPDRPFSVAGKILFVAGARGGIEHLDIYAINADGTGLRNLTKDPAYYDFPAAAPDGSAFAFFRGLTPSDSGTIYLVDSNGRHRILGSPAYLSYLTWSPDGQRLAFIKNRDVYTMSLAGDTTRVTLDGVDFKATPAWSPDGSFIAYSRYVDPQLGYELHRMTASGLADTVLASLNGDDLAPAWSGSGAFITFVHRDGALGHLVRLDLATGDTMSLTTGDTVVDQSPTYSPTGDSIAFYRQFLSTSIQPQEVYLLPPGSSNPVPVTAFGLSKFASSVVWVGHP